MPPDDGPVEDLLAGLPDAVYRLDRQGRFTHVNPAAERLLERSARDLVGCLVEDCFPDFPGSVADEQYRAALADGRPREFEFYYEPQQRWYEVRVFPIPAGLVAFFRDVDVRHRTDERRRTEYGELAAVLEALPTPTVLVDAEDRILLTNRAWDATGELLRLDGMRPVGIGGEYLDAMATALLPDDYASVAHGLRRLRAADAPATGRFDIDFSFRIGHATVWHHLQAARVEGTDRLVITHTDVTERVVGAQALAWQAAHDDLTRLPNRSAMLELMSAALTGEGGTGGPGRGTALLVVDLDSFQTINDSLGHQIGDMLLRQVSTRLGEWIRPGDVLGRLGGDHFLVLARDCDEAEAAVLALRLQESFEQPFDADGIAVPLSASIGAAVAAPGADAHQLLGDADAAMYAAKASGRDHIRLFTPGLREEARWRLEVATRLRDDATRQLVVHYQPQLSLRSGRVEAVEALVRWQHPTRGLLMPDTFLPVIEETGQVVPITRWLLMETTRRAVAWAAEGLALRMSVNISARHFSTETLVRDVRRALHESGLPPEQLVLELTESSIAEDPTRAEDQLALLRAMGVRVAIDDFGTGWSSLARLFSMPINTLKIDRSLLVAAERVAGEDSGAVLGSIVGLTRTLGITSVAEGVETARHLRMVRDAGCDFAQGWLLSQPLPPDRIPAWIHGMHDTDRGGDLISLSERGCA